MIALSKIVGIISCGFMLAVGLSDQTVCAGDEMTVSRSTQRIGGQAGQPYNPLKYEHASVQPLERVDGPVGARIGGQAGRIYDHIKHEHASVQPGGRIGGQAGEGHSPIQLEQRG